MAEDDHTRRIRAVLSDPMLDEAMMLDQINGILDDRRIPPTPRPIAAVGEEPLEPLVSTATIARIRPLPEDELRADLEEAQRSARFWQGQAENWEREHQNTVLPYTTKLENERDLALWLHAERGWQLGLLRTVIKGMLEQISRVRAIAEEAPEPRGFLRRRILAVLDANNAESDSPRGDLRAALRFFLDLDAYLDDQAIPQP